MSRWQLLRGEAKLANMICTPFSFSGMHACSSLVDRGCSFPGLIFRKCKDSKSDDRQFLCCPETLIDRFRDLGFVECSAGSSPQGRSNSCSLRVSLRRWCLRLARRRIGRGAKYRVKLISRQLGPKWCSITAGPNKLLRQKHGWFGEGQSRGCVKVLFE